MTPAAPTRSSRICGFREYCSVVGERYFPVDFTLRSGTDATFVSRFLSRPIGSLEFTQAMATSWVVGYRAPEHVDPRGPDRFLLNITLSGHVRHAQFGRRIDAPAGYMALVDSRSQYRSEQLTTTRALFVRLPGAPLRSAIGTPEDFCAIAMDARYGLNATLLDFLLGVWRQRDVLTPVEKAALASKAIELIAVACDVLRGVSRPPARLSSDQLFAKALQFIDEHLSDPHLDATAAAKAIGLSRGRLQAIARHKHTTIGRTILSRRLERCRRALADPGQARWPISQIAFNWGFSDAAHFSRAFNTHFGMSPRTYRKHAFASGEIPAPTPHTPQRSAQIGSRDCKTTCPVP
jgi:AraC-like DNA-binding protein